MATETVQAENRDDKSLNGKGNIVENNGVDPNTETNCPRNGDCGQENGDIGTELSESGQIKEPLLDGTGETNCEKQHEYCVQNDQNVTGVATPSADGCVKRQTSRAKPDLDRATSCYDNAPDGGWGWMVTFSAFMVGVILDGISFSFGIFFKELLIYFQESKSLTSWIISVFNGTYLGLGPVSSVMVSIFGCRRVAIFGAILASVSFFLCTLSPNVQVMILLYGLLGGTGLGFLYLPAIVTVGHYFKKRRALATGIAVCGSGIGGFVFAPVSEILIELYTWKGAMWIISAIVLNGVPIAALLRPLEGQEDPLIDQWRKSKSARKLSQQKQKQNGAASVTLLQEKSQQNGHDRNVASEDHHKPCCDVNSMFDFELLKSVTFLVYGCSCFLCMLGFYIPFTYIPDLADEFGMTSQEGAMLISIIGILNTVARILVGYVADRPGADSLIINSVALVIGGVATMFVPFYSLFGIMSAYSVVFGVSIEFRLKWEKLDTKTVARILVGYVADRPGADSLIINSLALVIGGVATMFVPFYSSFGIMSAYLVIFGVSIAVFVSLRSIIMAELLGIEKLTSSFGLVTMCQGLSAFIGAPIAGALSDIAGDYKGAFYMAGAAIALSGTICFPLRRISKWENSRKGTESHTIADILNSQIELKVTA